MKLSQTLFSLSKTPLGDLIVGLAFGKLSKVLPVKKVLETDKVIAFWHPKPFWEKHILIVPKKQIKSLATLKEGDEIYIAEVYLVVGQLISKLKWQNEGYTLLTNGGSRQEVNQLHFHLTSGTQLK